MLHTHKITPALLTAISRDLFSLRAIMLGNKTQETSVSRTYTLLGYTPEIFLGINFGQNYTRKSRELHKIILRIYLAKFLRQKVGDLLVWAGRVQVCVQKSSVLHLCC